jgi:hypothetical protein
MSDSNRSEYDIRKSNEMLYLKGRIVGYSVRKGMKWSYNHKISPAFQIGYDEGFKAPDNDFPWYEATRKAEITAIHIEYNHRRHERPHTSSEESDKKVIHSVSMSFWNDLSAKARKAAEMVDKKEEVSE